MSVFMIVCLAERGAYYATFGLARALINRRHTVIYAGNAEFKEDVERQGLTFVTMYPDVRGTDPNLGEIPSKAIQRLLYFYRQARKNPRRHSGLFNAIVEGEFELLLKSHKVDVVLLDPFLNLLAVVCKKANVAVVSLATELMNYKNFAVPPNFSLFAPKDSFLSRYFCHALWARHFVLAHLRRAALLLLTKVVRLPTPPRALRQKLKQLQRDSRLGHLFSEYSWRFDLPEIVLCPQAFDFPVARRGTTRKYLGMAMDRSREELPLSGKIPRDKKIVYVSLGTHAALYGRLVDRFIQQVFQVARHRQEYYFVTNIGKGNHPEKYGECPENVLAATFVPQLDVLSVSDAVMTNGGLGTVKEAIMAEVPLLVAPCRWDQYGNAARVRYHGIGEVCDIRKVTPQLLLQKLDDLIQNDRYPRALAALKCRIAGDREFDQGLEWIESFANT